MRVKRRRATCEEVDCPHFLYGWIDPQGIQHPAGMECGAIHSAPVEEPLSFVVKIGVSQQEIAGTEFLDRLHESVHTVERVLGGSL